MKQIGYAMRFTGSGAPKPGKDDELAARSGSATASLSNSFGPGGPELSIEDGPGQTASFESNVQVLGDGMFTEDGTIDFGEAGSLSFSTIGRGWMGPSPVDGVQHGAIMWKVDGGSGPLAGATGIITSNFTISAAGDVADCQWGILYLGG